MRTGAFAQAFEGGPSESAGRPLKPCGDARMRWMVATDVASAAPGQDPAYRSTRPLPRTGCLSLDRARDALSNRELTLRDLVTTRAFNADIA